MISEMKTEKEVEKIVIQLLKWQNKDTPLEIKVKWGKERILRLLESK